MLGLKLNRVSKRGPRSWTHLLKIKSNTTTTTWAHPSPTDIKVTTNMTSWSYSTRELLGLYCIVYSMVRRVCRICKRNLGHVNPLSNDDPIHIPWQTYEMLRPNHICYIPGPPEHVLSTQQILGQSTHNRILHHHLILYIGRPDARDNMYDS